jgi:hypothetical protein
MSELLNANGGRDFRWRLLSTASAIALIASGAYAADGDGDHPTIWIELGGQLERTSSTESVFAPAFFADAPPNILAPLVNSQRSPSSSIGEEGQISFEPQGSDWTISISARYGRASAARHLHYQTVHTTHQTFIGNPVHLYDRPIFEYGDGQTSFSESHLVLDFKAGRDVGLGMFGAGGTSTFSAGVRFAQFSSSADVSLHARPHYHSGPRVKHGTPPGFYYSVNAGYFQRNIASIQSKRSTQAIGPALSWDASAPVLGNASHMEVSFDWGVNAALLFGRQRAHVQHQTTGGQFYVAPGSYYPLRQSGYTNPPMGRDAKHTVTIPNLGGFAGVSFRYSDAKIKFGYRGDFFFNAMDNGIDTRKSETIGFYGPFATVSIGIGG